jgi:hypothetical protein
MENEDGALAGMRALTYAQVEAMGVVPGLAAYRAEWAAGAARLGGRVTFDLTDPAGFEKRCRDVVAVGRGALREAALLGGAPAAPPPAVRNWLAGWAEFEGEDLKEAVTRMAETPSDRTFEMVRQVGWFGVDLLLEEHYPDARAAVERAARRRAPRR